MRFKNLYTPLKEEKDKTQILHADSTFDIDTLME